MWILYKMNYKYGYEEISNIDIELLYSFTTEEECKKEYDRLQKIWEEENKDDYWADLYRLYDYNYDYVEKFEIQ